MTWTAPATVVAGQIMNAAFWNTQVRDNELVLATIPTVTSFSSSGTYSKPADLKWAVVELWGGGASGSSAGGGGLTGPAVGAGGGGGAYCRNLYAASSLLSSETVTVGVGGNGNSGNGNGGTASTFKSLTANGGSNGVAMAFTNVSALANAGSGGVASGGDVNLTGDDGGKGQVLLTGSTPTVIWVNNGGGSPLGGGMTTFGGSSVGGGNTGKFPGGGASGAYAVSTTGQNGVNGAGGRVLIYSYFS
jgi:hypothetical protein